MSLGNVFQTHQYPNRITIVTNCVFEDYINMFVIVFNDDILVYSKINEEHEKHEQAILQSVSGRKVYGKLKKCEFWLNKPQSLVAMVSIERTFVNTSRIEVVSSWKQPTKAIEVCNSWM